MRRVWWGRFALALAPCLFFAGVLECGLRRQVLRSGVTPFQVSEDLQLPHSLRPSFETTYKGHTIRTNARGFRGPPFPEPRSGVPRVALVGDSICFGDALGWDDTLGVQLEQCLAEAGCEAQVLNFGIPGFDVTDVTQLAREQVLPLEPDLLVYVFVSNDVDESKHVGSIPPDAEIDAFSKFPLRSALLQYLGVRVKGVVRKLRGGSTQGGWVSKIQNALASGGAERLDRSIGALHVDCEARSVPFVVASFPFLVTREQNPFAEIEAAAARCCQRHGVSFLDLSQAFPDSNLGRYWSSPFDSHPDREANRLVAEFLAGEFQDRLQ